jgi:hypothetical protein
MSLKVLFGLKSDVCLSGLDRRRGTLESIVYEGIKRELSGWLSVVP